MEAVVADEGLNPCHEGLGSLQALENGLSNLQAHELVPPESNAAIRPDGPTVGLTGIVQESGPTQAKLRWQMLQEDEAVMPNIPPMGWALHAPDHGAQFAQPKVQQTRSEQRLEPFRSRHAQEQLVQFRSNALHGHGPSHLQAKGHGLLRLRIDPKSQLSDETTSP